jgi:hypothetical protein
LDNFPRQSNQSSRYDTHFEPNYPSRPRCRLTNSGEAAPAVVGHANARAIFERLPEMLLGCLIFIVIVQNFTPTAEDGGLLFRAHRNMFWEVVCQPLKS